MKQYHKITHEFDPVFNTSSEILILGSFPSVKSREQQFYYGYERNRFWAILSSLFYEPLPSSIAEKKVLLLKHHIALWDVIWQCDIEGSSDSSISNVVPNNLSVILDAAPIKQIYGNGAKAYELYYRYQYPSTKREMIKLPSTSPANAAWTFPKLLHAWNTIV